MFRHQQRVRIWLQRLKDMRLVSGIANVISRAELFRRVDQADHRPPLGHDNMLNRPWRMRLGNTVCPRLSQQPVDITTRPRRTRREQNRLVVRLPGDNFCALAAADHLRDGLLWLQ